MAWSEERELAGESNADAEIRRGSLEQADRDLEETESLFRDALRALEHASVPDDPALFGKLIPLGQLLVEQGAFEEAESLYTKALKLSETAAGAYDDELPILLRELSRLYILQSAYDRAEQPLLRLLAITEAQGEGRPEVATALASLAAVRHALGDYGSADQLYREALNIRETTLAPNHITTAATMESLAETSAARGRFAEAISLSSRALSIREMTLGSNDASVRQARQRIADLQLEAQEENRVSTPPRSAPALQFSPPVDEVLTERRVMVRASPLPAVLIPWADELTAVQEEIESDLPVRLSGRAPWRSAVATTLETRSAKAIAVAAGVVVVLAALGFKLQVGNKPDVSTFVEAEPFNPAAKPEIQPMPAAVGPSVAPTPSLDTIAIASRRDVIIPTSPPVVSRAALPPAVPREVARQQAPPASVAVTPPPKRANATAPSSSRADAVVASRAGNLPAPPVTDSVPVRAAPPPVTVAVEKPPDTRPAVTAPPANAPTSPTLIGSAPQPLYPEALRDQQVEGEVVVQFVVDENGRADVSSMTVVRSPNVLLTNAVRAVLPQFRFEPARTAPPRSMPRPETVRHAFTFRVPRG